MVKVTGAGIQDGVLSHRERLFYLDTSEAGKGEVEVEIGGPRGMLWPLVYTSLQVSLHFLHIDNNFLHIRSKKNASMQMEKYWYFNHSVVQYYSNTLYNNYCIVL